MKIKINLLKNVTSNITTWNRFSPFPVVDTEYLEKLKEQLESMTDEDHNYDDDPVHACKYCKNLNVQYDDEKNEICMRCGSQNATVKFDKIFEYLKFKKEDDE